MKNKKLFKKLNLGKKTISNLNQKEMGILQGGSNPNKCGLETRFWKVCTSYLETMCPAIC